MISAVEFAHVIELLDRIATPSIVDRALRASNLNRRAIRETEGYFPYRLEASVVEYVARATGDQRLGAKLGDQFNYSAYDAYARYVLTALNLKQAISRAHQAFPLISPGNEITLDVREDHLVAGRYSGLESVVGHRHLDDGAVVIITRVLQHFLGPDWHPEWVEVGGADSKRAAYLEKLTGAPLRTGARSPGVAVRMSDLSAKNPQPPDPDQVLAYSELPGIMGVRPLTTVRDLVWHMLSIQFALRDMTQDAVAQQLNMGARSLQRALQLEGTTFREVKAAFIQSRAEILLARSEYEISSIARSLGYEEPKSFNRAFRKLTGMTPHAYRTKNVAAQ